MASTATLAAHAAARTVPREPYDQDHAARLLSLLLVARARATAASSLYAKLPSAARLLAEEAWAYLGQLRREAAAAKETYEAYLRRYGKNL